MLQRIRSILAVALTTVVTLTTIACGGDGNDATVAAVQQGEFDCPCNIVGRLEVRSESTGRFSCPGHTWLWVPPGVQIELCIDHEGFELEFETDGSAAFQAVGLLGPIRLGYFPDESEGVVSYDVAFNDEEARFTVNHAARVRVVIPPPPE